MCQRVAIAWGARLVLVSALLVGCGGAEDDLPRRAISGEVTLDDRPLERGQISFVPISAETGTQVGGPIVAGAYEVPRAQGPVPGRYSVRIHGGSDGGNPDDPAEAYKVEPDPVPARYNTQTTLQVEIEPDGPDTLDFALQSK